MKIKILIVLLVLFVPVIVIMAQGPEPVRFVQGDGTFDNFLNNALNDIQALFLSVIAPAAGLVIVGRNLFKRFLPANEYGEVVGLGIMGVLFLLYHAANAAGATQQLQEVVDAITLLGQAFALGGVTTVVSSMSFRVSKAHDNTVFGFQRSQQSNG